MKKIKERLRALGFTDKMIKRMSPSERFLHYKASKVEEPKPQVDAIL